MDVLEEFFPSKHLRAADIQGKEVKVTIARVEREKLGDDMKPVVYFNGKDKGVVLNKGNTNVLVDAFGRQSTDWFGQEVILFAIMTDYQGKPTLGLRMRLPTARDRAPVKREDPITSGPQPAREVPSDDIPF